MTCPDCDGEGEIDDEPCENCDGDGWINSNEPDEFDSARDYDVEKSIREEL